MRDLERFQQRTEELERDARATRSDLYGVENRIATAKHDGASNRTKALLEAERDTLSGDLAMIEAEARRCRARVERASLVLFQPDTTASCWTCGGTGALQGNGSAAYGGRGGRAVSE